MYHEEAIDRAGTMDPEFVTGLQWGGGRGWSQCGEIQEMVQPNTVLGPFWDPDLKNGTAQMALGKWREVRCGHILETAEVWLAVPGAVAGHG